MARNEFLNCQVTKIREIDDKLKDAKAIALQLTDLCNDEYEALNKIFARYNLDTSNERRMFTIDRNAEIVKIDASLPIVNLNRYGELPR